MLTVTDMFVHMERRHDMKLQDHAYMCICLHKIHVVPFTFGLLTLH